MKKAQTITLVLIGILAIMGFTVISQRKSMISFLSEVSQKMIFKQDNKELSEVSSAENTESILSSTSEAAISEVITEASLVLPYTDGWGEEEMTPQDYDDYYDEDQGAAPGDGLVLSEYPYRVLVYEIGIISDLIGGDSAWQIEPALDDYFKQFDPDGGNYIAVVDAESFHESQTLPSVWITVYIGESKLRIKCCYLFFADTGYFFFHSELGDTKPPV